MRSYGLLSIGRHSVFLCQSGLFKQIWYTSRTHEYMQFTCSFRKAPSVFAWGKGGKWLWHIWRSASSFRWSASLTLVTLRSCWASQIWDKCLEWNFDYPLITDYGWSLDSDNKISVIWDSADNQEKIRNNVKYLTRGCKTCKTGCKTKRCACFKTDITTAPPN